MKRFGGPDFHPGPYFNWTLLFKPQNDVAFATVAFETPNAIGQQP